MAEHFDIEHFDIEHFDIEASGLLDGLKGQARAERAEAIEWLRSEGFTVITSAARCANAATGRPHRRK